MWLPAAFLAALALATTALPWHDAVATTQTVGPVLAFLAAVTVLAQLSDATGLFDAVGTAAARACRGSTPRLFLAVAALATASTVLLSLDTTAVLLTPVVLALTAAAGVAPRPFAYSVVWLANAASLLLPISNLTNLLAVGTLHLSTADYARRMLGPEAAAVVVVVVVLLLRFRREVRGSYAIPARFRCPDRLLLWASGAGCLSVAPAALLGVAPWKAAVPAALALALVSAVRGRSAPAALRLMPWRLLVLAESLFLLVATLDRHGLSRLLRHVVGHGTLQPELVAAGLGNLTNNLPAYLALQGATPHGSQLGILLGVDAGPLLLLSGSLATLLWRERCTARDLRVGAGEFFRMGLLVLGPLLAALWLALRFTG